MKKKFKQKLGLMGSAGNGNASGWGVLRRRLDRLRTLFARVDTDGSGTIDVGEFMVAVRNYCGIGSDLVSDVDLRGLFQEVDADGSGEIDADEFGEFLQVLRNATWSFCCMKVVAYVWSH